MFTSCESSDHALGCGEGDSVGIGGFHLGGSLSSSTCCGCECAGADSKHRCGAIGRIDGGSKLEA
jgi:hypothetical protein